MSAATAITGRRSGQAGGQVVFFLGTHQPGWLSRAQVPLFVSDRRLRRYRRLPVAATAWALDSGGFTELAAFGTWSSGPTPRAYVQHVRRYIDHVGRLAWAAPQDWMCEPWVVRRTGLSVAEHLRRTVDNYLRLRDLAPDLPFVPVVQGWQIGDYLHCVDLYTAADIDLTAAPLVGLGSVCRRQATGEAAAIITELRAAGITRLHGFGIKILGLRRYGQRLASADSMAWSLAARHTTPLPGCTHTTCANCSRFALAWRDQVIASLPNHEQPSLFDPDHLDHPDHPGHPGHPDQLGRQQREEDAA